MTFILEKGTARAKLHQGEIPALLEPIEVAKLALFLASDDSRCINGAVIPIDGGWCAA